LFHGGGTIRMGGLPHTQGRRALQDVWRIELLWELWRLFADL